MLIKTLIVDDTILYRKVFSEVLGYFSEIEVVGTAPNGDIALRKMAKDPVDLVFCDVYMPGKNGVETLIEIKKCFPMTVVVMMSGISSRNADITIRALELGAVDFIRKPEGGTIKDNILRLKMDIGNVLRLVKIRLNIAGAVRPSASRCKTKALSEKDDSFVMPKPKTFGIFAIGVSTGGPEALNKLIPELPANLPVPTILVQHMPPLFTRSLAQSLDGKSPLHVVEGEEEQPVRPGTIYIAPGGRHMTVRQNDQAIVIGLNDGPPENSCRPSVDVMFRSVATAYGGKGILAAVLTGMGSDGLNGIRTMKRKGCYCITQSASSCVVYGMPRALDEAGLSDESIDLENMAQRVMEIISNRDCF